MLHGARYQQRGWMRVAVKASILTIAQRVRIGAVEWTNNQQPHDVEYLHDREGACLDHIASSIHDLSMSAKEL